MDPDNLASIFQNTGHPEDEYLRPIQRLILLQNVLFTRRTLSFSLCSGTFYILHSFVSGLQTLRSLKKSLSLISSQSLLTLCALWISLAIAVTRTFQFRFRGQASAYTQALGGNISFCSWQPNQGKLQTSRRPLVSLGGEAVQRE